MLARKAKKRRKKKHSQIQAVESTKKHGHGNDINIKHQTIRKEKRKRHTDLGPYLMSISIKAHRGSLRD
jgi:hypothetical protein